MKQIKWSDSLKERTDPAKADWDWCGEFKGKYVDLTFRHNGTWSCRYDGKLIQGELPSRDVALQKLTDFLVDK